MNKLPSLSNTEFLILGLLVRGRELYGLEMVKAESRLKRGTIYVLLGRLEDKGFVVSRQVVEKGVSGLPKRRYSITGAGIAVFNAFTAAAATLEFFIPPGEPA